MVGEAHDPQERYIVRRVPRGGAYADAPGSYVLIPRLRGQQVVDPGESIEGEILISGYGAIGPTKFVFYPPSSALDTSQCRFFVRDFKINEERREYFIETLQTDEFGETFSLQGGGYADDYGCDYFFDLNQGNTLLIHTEALMKIEPDVEQYGPIRFIFRIKTDARPGQYAIMFSLTYFDGDLWKTSSERISFTVRNILQRNEVHFGIVAYTAAVATVVSAVVATIDAWDKIVPVYA